MVLKLLLFLLALGTAGEALAEESRSMPVAMTVAVLDVAKSHCRSRLNVDPGLEARLIEEFRRYDVGGVQSSLSGPLNSFYEDFLQTAKTDLKGFCEEAPMIASRGGYPGLLTAP